jgi:hemerythrin
LVQRDNDGSAGLAWRPGAWCLQPVLRFERSAAAVPRTTTGKIILRVRVMAHLVWKNELNTGIEVIDNQHKRIVDMINQLNRVRQAHRQNKKAKMEAVGNVIGEMVDYTLSHFAFEEALMEDAGYQFTRAHKRVHELFIKRVSEYQTRFQSGEDIADELHGLLSRWLVNHIRNDDAAYAPAIKSSMGMLAGDRGEGGWLSRKLKQFFK